ncbi:MAG: cell division protein SepF [Clostridiales bacterium]|nr:cell division protein SepF [Clostridiales bacterium]
MANFVDKIKDFIAGPYDDEYEDDYDDYEDDDEIEEYRPRTSQRRETTSRETRESLDYSAPRTSTRRTQTQQPQVVDFNKSQNTQQVVIMKPECYNDAQGICDNIKAKRPVVVNLEKVEYPVAQRIMDFLSGTCYSLEGSIQRVSTNIFIIAPVNFDIASDTREEPKLNKSVILPWVNQK